MWLKMKLSEVELKNILIVDDEEVAAKLLETRINKSKIISCECKFSLSSRQAVEIINTENISLLILDLNMPNFSGIELIEQLRKEHSPISLPILVHTNDLSDNSLVEALEKGANDYIPKNMEWEIAETRIFNHLAMTDLVEISGKVSSGEAVAALVTSYNHEINNPLCVAYGRINILIARESEENQKDLEIAKSSVEKITYIIEKMTQTAEKLNKN